MLSVPSAWNVFRGEASTTSLGSLFQYFNVNNFFLISSVNESCFILNPLLVVTSPGKRLFSVFILSLLQVLENCRNVSLDPPLFQTKQPQPSWPHGRGPLALWYFLWQQQSAAPRQNLCKCLKCEPRTKCFLEQKHVFYSKWAFRGAGAELKNKKRFCLNLHETSKMHLG